MGSSCSSSAAATEASTTKSALRPTDTKTKKPQHPLEAPSKAGQRKVYRSVIPTPETPSLMAKAKTSHGEKQHEQQEAPPHNSGHQQQPSPGTTRTLTVAVKSHNLSQDSDVLSVESVSGSTSLLLHSYNQPHRHPGVGGDSPQKSFGETGATTPPPSTRQELCPLPQALSHSLQTPNNEENNIVETPQSSCSPATREHNWGAAHIPSQHRTGVRSPIIEATITNDTTSNTFPHPDEEEEEDHEFQATLHQLATAEWRSNEPTPTNTPPLAELKQTTRMWSASSQSADVDEAALIAYMKAGRDAFGTSMQSDASRPSQRISDSMAANAGGSMSLNSTQFPLHTSNQSDASGGSEHNSTTPVAAPGRGGKQLTLFIEPSSLSASQNQ